MKSMLCLAVLAASLAGLAAPAAMAEGSRTYGGGHSGSTGGTPGAAMGAATGSAETRHRPDAGIAARRGPGQKPVELQQTTLLNQLSAAGYVTVRDFRKDGDRYVASAMDGQGRWTTVVLDPRDSTTTPGMASGPISGR